MQKRIREPGYVDYLNGENWRCSNSPTGAHHWVIGHQTTCKYCLAVRQFQTFTGRTTQKGNGKTEDSPDAQPIEK